MIAFPQPLLPATLLGRVNRFRVALDLGGVITDAHLANSGRLAELLIPGATCRVAPALNAQRKTPYDLLLVEHDGGLVCVDARLPNKSFRDLLNRADAGDSCARALLGSLAGYSEHLAEAAAERSRFDFRLSGPNLPPCWIECKSVTLVQDGTARFPDAPTIRGARHLEDLCRRVALGERAAVVFVVCRNDAQAFEAHAARDPDFAQALSDAVDRGVRVIAYRCNVSSQGMEIAAEIPVRL